MAAARIWPKTDIYGNTELHQAALKLDVAEVERLLNNGADIHVMNNFRLTPLLCASAGCFSAERWAMLKLLIEHGAGPFEIDQTEETFLHKLRYSSPDEFHEVAVYLIARKCSSVFNYPGGRCGVTTLHAVCRRLELKVETLCLLFKNGARFEVVDRAGNDFLKDMVVRGWDVTALDTFVRYGANLRRLSSTGENLIHIATVAGSIDAMEWAVGKGLDINFSDRVGNTPLHTVISSGTNKTEDEVMQVVKALVRNGASLSMRNNDGLSVRELAARKKLLTVLRYLDNEACIQRMDRRMQVVGNCVSQIVHDATL